MNSLRTILSSSRGFIGSNHSLFSQSRSVEASIQRRGLRTVVDKLPWDWRNGLLPVFSPKTLDITLNSIVKKNLRMVNEMTQGTDLHSSSLVDLVQSTSSSASDAALHNHASSLWNHTFFLHCLVPGGRDPSDKMKQLIEDNFESLEALKKKIKFQARGLIGNGFIWLVDNNGSLELITTPNYSSPLIWPNTIPILGVSIWQHSYFLDHKDNLEGYLDAWFHVINWDAVESHYAYVVPISKTGEVIKAKEGPESSDDSDSSSNEAESSKGQLDELTKIVGSADDVEKTK